MILQWEFMAWTLSQLYTIGALVAKERVIAVLFVNKAGSVCRQWGTEYPELGLKTAVRL